MRKSKVIFSLLMFLLMTTIAWGLSSSTGKWQTPTTALFLDTDTRLDINALEMFVYNDGNFCYDNANVLGKTDGLYFPRGTKKTVIYSAGLWIGGKVNGETRLAIAEYSSEYVPGPMANGTFTADSPSYRVYKVNRGDTPETNPDYANWPVDQGAPVDDDGNPAILGDQMAWAVFNDADPAGHINDASGTAPLGIEVQMSSFAYARGGALGNTAFVKYLLINKGENTIDSTFISLWADPDLGNASDDLVGCDTTLSLGYCYNEGPDSDYGANPPACGFDFFQGPIVPLEEGEVDSALVGGEWIQGFKNLPMTSFNKYINGTDPASPTETYNYMNGLLPGGGPVVDPDSVETKFFVAGDPVTGEGWIDEASADRRYMMSSGPFTMAPGDTQEVVAAVVVAQGSNPLTSISALREVDRAAQAVFDLNFAIPFPPPSPTVYARGLEDEIELIWTSDAVGDVQINEPLNQEFRFEGFKLYQGETANGPWTLFATYDVPSEQFLCGFHIDEGDTVFEYCSATKIYNDIVDPGAGGTQRVIVINGEDTDIRFNTTLNRSQITGEALKANQPYYFAVTAFSVEVRNAIQFNDVNGNELGYITEVLESPIIPAEVKPTTHPGVGTERATHADGVSDGFVEAVYIFPDEVTGDTYEVTFNADGTWNLRNTTTNETLLSNVTSQNDDFDHQVVDGIMWRVVGPPSGMADWDWEGSGRWVSGVDWGGHFFFGGLDNASEFNGSTVPASDYVDVELRFSNTGNTQMAHLWERPSYAYQGFFEVPFTAWDVSADPERQINICFVEDASSPCRDNTWLPCTSGGTAEREYLFIMSSTYTGTPVQAYTEATPFGTPEQLDAMYALWPRIRGAHVPADEIEDGQKFIIIANKPNLETDRFVYETKQPKDATGDGSVVSATLDDVKTVPNPYYSYYQEETDQFDRIIKFINMPATADDMTIKIYNIAGDLLRTMDRPGGTTNTEFVWDLKTDAGLWVASGIYIWVIEAPGLGTKYGKMAVFPEVEQLDTF